MKLLLPLIAVSLLAGCASQEKMYSAYLAAKENERANTPAAPPLFALVAAEGQTITITGLARMEFNAPPSAQIQQSQLAAPPQDPYANVLSNGIGVLGQIAGYAYGAKTALGLADTIGKSATAGYSFIQAPAANVSSSVVNTSTVANRTVTKDSGNTTSLVDSGNTFTSTKTSSVVAPVTTTTSTVAPITTTTSTVNTNSFNPATSTTSQSNNPNNVTTYPVTAK